MRRNRKPTFEMRVVDGKGVEQKKFVGLVWKQIWFFGKGELARDNELIIREHQ